MAYYGTDPIALIAEVIPFCKCLSRSCYEDYNRCKKNAIVWSLFSLKKWKPISVGFGKSDYMTSLSSILVGLRYVYALIILW